MDARQLLARRDAIDPDCSAEELLSIIEARCGSRFRDERRGFFLSMLEQVEKRILLLESHCLQEDVAEATANSAILKAQIGAMK